MPPSSKEICSTNAASGISVPLLAKIMRKQASMQVSDRSCLMKGGFELIAVGFLQMLDCSVHLLPLRGTHDLVGPSIESNEADLPDGTKSWAGQENRDKPDFPFPNKPPGVVTQATKRVMADNVAIRSLQNYFRFGTL